MFGLFQNQQQTPKKSSALSSLVSLNEDMPEKIYFDGIGDLDAIEDDFSKGLEDIETQFHKLVVRAENDFDVKHSQLKVVYRKLYKNYTFVQNLHERKQEELLRAEQRIQREKDAWMHEKQTIEGLTKFDNDIFKLDVGGARLKVSKDTLTEVPGSLLEKMFSGKHDLKIDHDDVIYIDRDFKAFDAMVKFLRNHRKVYPKF